MHAGTPDKAHLHVYRYSICFSIAQISCSIVLCFQHENMEYMYTLNVISLANVVGAKTEPAT